MINVKTFYVNARQVMWPSSHIAESCSVHSDLPCYYDCV